MNSLEFHLWGILNASYLKKVHFCEECYTKIDIEINKFIPKEAVTTI